MEDNVVKVSEYAAELFRLAGKLISSGSSARVRFTVGTGKTYCRVMVAEDGQELTDDENVYNLFTAADRWKRTTANYQNCRRRLIRILADVKHEVKI